MLHAGVAAIRLETVANLGGELAGRGQHQAADRTPRLARGTAGQAAAWIGCKAMQDGQGKSGGLAGTGLRDTQQVAPGQDARNRAFLNRGGVGVTFFAYSA